MPFKEAIKNICLKLDKLLGIALILILVCFIFVLAHKAIFDLDIWLHLQTGKLIVQNKIIPSQDFFSFTRAGFPWLDHSWLFQVVSYLVNEKWQFDGLIFLQSCVITLTFLVLFAMGYKSISSYLEVAAFLFFTAYAVSDRFNIRPDIFSMLFFSLYLYFLRFNIENRRIWFLLLIQILWVNMHGYFILGPLLVLLFIIAEFLRRKIKFLPWHWKEEFVLSDGAYNRLKKLFLFILLIGFLNPRGAAGALYPLHVFRETLLGSNKIFFKYIQELAPTFRVYSSWRSFYNIIAICCFSLMLVNAKRLKIIEIILTLFFFFFAFTLRNTPFFLFIAYMVMVTYIGKTLKRMSLNIEFRTSSKEVFYHLFKCGIGIVFIAWLLARLDAVLLTNYYDFEAKEIKSALLDIQQSSYPKAAVDFLLKNNIGPNIFNDFNSGAYLIGRAYPKIKVFIDGRTEFYGSAFFSQYQNLLEGDVSIFEKTIKRYNLDAILLTMTVDVVPQIANHIYKSPQWKLVFLDESALVFIKDTPAHQELIKKCALDFKKYSAHRLSVKDIGIRWIYPSPYIKRASLLHLLGEYDAVIAECKEALRVMPNCAEAYHFIGKAYFRKKLYQEALDNLHSASVLMPHNLEMVTDFGVCLKELKENQAAIDIFKKVIKSNKAFAPAYYQLGRAYLSLKNEDEAIKFLKKATSYASRDPFFHFKLGKAFYGKGAKSKDNSYVAKAKAEFKMAAELNIQRDQDLAKEIEESLKEIRERSPETK